MSEVPWLIKAGGLFLVVGGFTYFVPTIIAIWRDVPNKLPIALLNILFGWSIICWAIALVFALGPTRRQVRAMEQREQLSIDADLALVAMERRSREALKWEREPTFRIPR